jgi:hypothetical protein
LILCCPWGYDHPGAWLLALGRHPAVIRLDLPAHRGPWAPSLARIVVAASPAAAAGS